MSIFCWSWANYQSHSPRDQRVKDRNPTRSQAQGICLRLGSVFWTSKFSLALLFSILNLFWKLHGGWDHFSSPQWNLWKPELKWGTGIPAPKVDSSHPNPLEEIGYIYMILQTFSLIWKIEDILFDHWLLGESEKERIALILSKSTRVF